MKFHLFIFIFVNTCVMLYALVYVDRFIIFSRIDVSDLTKAGCLIFTSCVVNGFLYLTRNDI